MIEFKAESEVINLAIPKEKYNFLLKTIKEFKTRIYSWGFDKFMSKKLLTDLRIIESILNSNKNGGNEYVRHDDKRPDSINGNPSIHSSIST